MRSLFPKWASKLCSAAVLLWVGTGLTAKAATTDDARFSTTLSETQRTESGFTQLSEDNIAVIDALVRQDEAALKRRGSLPGFGSFSERRSDREKEIAGLAKLTPAQLTRLDGLAGMRISPPTPIIVSEGAPRKSAPVVLLRPTDRPYSLEVHGSMSLSYGWSKEGSTRGGEMNIRLEDPKGRFAIGVGYSEYHVKGGAPVYDPTDDTYRYRPSEVIPVER